MMYNRSVIRKLILLEMRDRLIAEQAPAASASAPSIPPFKTEDDKQNMLQGMDKLINALKGEVTTIDESQASGFERRLYEATKGGTLDLGLGTDEEEIEKVLKEIPTIVDVSYVSAKFEKTHQGSWTFTPTLEAVFSSELDDTDMERYVNTVINTKMKTSFIRLGEFGDLGKDQFFDLISAGNNLGDLKSQFQGKAKSGIVAGSGVLSALDAATDDDSDTEFYLAPAASDVGIAAAAGTAARVGTRFNVMTGAPYGTLDGSINPVTSAKKLGGEIKTSVDDAADSARQTRILRRALGDAATELAVNAPGMDDAARAAAKEAGERATRKAVMKAGASAAARSLVTALPKIGLRAVPVLGWALFAAELADWAMSGNIQEDTALALDSNLYLKIKDMFAKVVPELEKRRAEISAVPVLESSDDGKGAAGEDGGECPPLSWGLEAPYVQNIIKTMNAYAENKGVEGYTEAPVSSSWRQDDQVQKSWLVFAKHALQNCNLYERFKDLDVNNWKEMSYKMKSTYPGYTPNPKGCLAFCLDAYCCKLTWGDQAPSRAGGGSGGSGGGSGGGRGGDEGEERKGNESKLAEGGGHEVTLNRTGENFKNSGFEMSNKTDPDEIFLLAIISNMTASSTRGGYPGGQISFKFNVRNGKVVDVDRVFGSRLAGQLNGIRIDPAIASLKDAAKLLKIPKSFADVRDIRVTFRITGGQIGDVRARARSV